MVIKYLAKHFKRIILPQHFLLAQRNLLKVTCYYVNMSNDQANVFVSLSK